MDVDQLKSGPEDREAAWATRVFERCGDRCSSCGGDERLQAVMIVPEEMGGKKVPENGALLCRVCEVARDIAARKTSPASGEHTRPINFYVSKALHAKLTNGVASDFGFRSISALVRYLMGKFVRNPDRFDDVSFWQDSGAADVKINSWVCRDMYATFQQVVTARGMTVTDALKGLILMHEANAARIAGKESS